jgi:hypothetical protein
MKKYKTLKSIKFRIRTKKTKRRQSVKSEVHKSNFQRSKVNMGIIWQLTIKKYTQKSLIIKISKTCKVLCRTNPKSKLM